ncbi:MarR family transcriptional regulator [Alteromonadaceae bacterium BrNp21-10]|nr:MarR family transcriptional regulator [Alteromonadaceae bacterium BrNp21-10]
MKNRNQLLGESIVNLSICYQHLSARINAQLAGLHLNMTQLSILNYFSWRGEHSETISSLARVMEMNQPAVTKAVKALVDKNALSKVADDNDARVTHLFMTPAGFKLLDQARQITFPLLVHNFAGLEDDELVLMNSMLEKIKGQLNL